MTDPNYTLLVIVADRSGSMIEMRDEAEQMINTLIADQTAQPGRCDVEVIGFNNSVSVDVPLTTLSDSMVGGSPRYTLRPSGGTALHDAVGYAISKVGHRISDMPEHARPGHVIIATVTDGHENCSQEHRASGIKTMITEQTEKYNWSFVFLGANQDAVLTARDLGIPMGSSMTYNSKSAAGIHATSSSLSSYVSGVRSRGFAAFGENDRRSAMDEDSK